MSNETDTNDEGFPDEPMDADVSVDVADEGDSDSRSAARAELPEVRSTGVSTDKVASLDRVSDLSVPVSVELGRTTLTVQQILELSPGVVVELDQSADAPVEMFVHGKCVAKGEIVVIDDFYGVRITSVREP